MTASTASMIVRCLLQPPCNGCKVQDLRDWFAPNHAEQHARTDKLQSLLRQVIRARQRIEVCPPVVLDFGTVFGLNAAMARYPLTMNMLRDRYRAPPLSIVGALELASLDRHFYRSWPEVGFARFVGIGRCERRIRHGIWSGLLEDGLVADLEHRALLAHERKRLQAVSIVVATDPDTTPLSPAVLGRLFEALPRLPWILWSTDAAGRLGMRAACAEAGLLVEAMSEGTLLARPRDQALSNPLSGFTSAATAEPVAVARAST